MHRHLLLLIAVFFLLVSWFIKFRHYLDFVTLDREPVVAQLSKLAIWKPGVENQDRILSYR